jgi:hypothetical protein
VSAAKYDVFISLNKDEYEDPLETMRRLAGQSPDNAWEQRDQTVFLERIGDMLKAGGDLPDALKQYEDPLEMIRRLG